jgi:hypothetical protein
MQAPAVCVAVVVAVVAYGCRTSLGGIIPWQHVRIFTRVF